MPNKLSQFWQELKRRNVTRVLAVYIAAAFMILELVDMTTQPFGLPDWSMKVAFFVLLAGLIVAVIISWIYDIHPEGGMVKTVPAHEVKKVDIPSSSNSWKIASYVSFVVIVGLIVMNIVPRTNNNRKLLEKSIAVLPLEYLSEDPNKEYLANAVLDAITGHLSLIEGLRVMPRTSVEQYRENRKSAMEIGEELDVSYLIEGSFLMIEDQVRLTIQLVVAEEGDHVFFKEYDRNYKDIIVVQSEVAKTIAKEIEVAISPEEKQLIEKSPTTDLTAYDFYQRGREEYWKYSSENDNRELLERAEEYYHEALNYDSTFALAYTGLARVYWDKHYWETFLSGNFLDSVLILADVALSFDDQLAEAYTVRGDYYSEIGLAEKAIEEYDKATIFNPNDWLAYWGKAWLYRLIYCDYVRAIDNFQKAVTLNRGSELPTLFESLGGAYLGIGFYEKCKYYIQEAVKLDGDSMRYYRYLTFCEFHPGNLLKAVEYGEKLCAIDTTNDYNLSVLGLIYVFHGQHEEALGLYKRYIETAEIGQDYSLFDMHRIGWAYWQNGYKKEAEYYFKEQIDYCNRMNELERAASEQLRTFYDLAAVYAFIGEKEKAYENLSFLNQSQNAGVINYNRNLKYDPLFNGIRDEPEFQQLLHDVESKYQAEHERVKQWLEKNDML